LLFVISTVLSTSSSRTGVGSSTTSSPPSSSPPTSGGAGRRLFQRLSSTSRSQCTLQSSSLAGPSVSLLPCATSVSQSIASSSRLLWVLTLPIKRVDIFQVQLTRSAKSREQRRRIYSAFMSNSMCL